MIDPLCMLLLVTQLTLLQSAEANAPSYDDPAVKTAAAPLELIIEQMGSESFAVREFASRTLIESDVSDQEIRNVLEQQSLGQEQYHRLLSGLRYRMINAPRGALGIRMSFRNNGNGPGGLGGRVLVTDLLDDLPAREVLVLGDAIVRLDGLRPKSTSDLILHVQSKRPGDSVRLDVERPVVDEQGQEILDEDGNRQIEYFEVDVILGSADLLEDNSRRLTQTRGGNVIDIALLARIEERLAEISYPRPVVPLEGTVVKKLLTPRRP